MKRNLVLGLNILTLIFTVPLLIFMCTTTGLVSYLAFNNLDAAVSRTARHSGPVRIRTIPPLDLISPAPVTNEPLAPAEAQVDPTVSEAALVGPANDIETSTGSSLAEETRMTQETGLTQNEPVAPAEVVVPAVMPLDTAAGNKSSTASPHNEVPGPAENLPVVEVPTVLAPAEPPAPEIAVNPESAQTAPSEPTFVPDSSFFDQLLEQVN